MKTPNFCRISALLAQAKLPSRRSLSGFAKAGLFLLWVLLPSLALALPGMAAAANVGFTTLGLPVPKDVLVRSPHIPDEGQEDRKAEKTAGKAARAAEKAPHKGAEPRSGQAAGRNVRDGKGGKDGQDGQNTPEATVPKGPDDALRFDINVWYPTDSRRRRLLDYQGWTFRAAVRADVREGRHPLILFSHPSSGNRFTHHDAARGLAARGFIVAAVTHPFDNLDAMRNPYSMVMLARRVRDLSVTLDLLLADETFGPHIDTGRIGVAGLGAGATAAFLLGGALPDCSLWKNFCQKEDTRDPYCNPWGREAVEKNICPDLPLQASLADTRIRAVAAVEPGFGVLFSQRALASFHPPVLLVFGDREDHESIAKERIMLPGRFGRIVETRYVNRANLEAFMSPCPDTLARELPELCLGVDAETRGFAQERLVTYLADFFTRTLVNTVPRAMPDPPSPEELQTLARDTGKQDITH